MATRLYFTTDALTGIGIPVVTQDASWEQFGSLRSWLSSRKLGSSFLSRALAETSTSGTYDSCQQQFVSKPLAAQTIAGTVKAIMRCAESNAAADMRSQMCIRVVSGDGGTVRGTLLAHDASALSNEWFVGSGVSLQNRKFPLNWSGAGATLTSVVAQAGDRLVVEIGNRAHNTVSTQYYGYIETGDGATTDCAENETDTFQYNPWIEFSQDIIFQEDVSRSCGDSENLLSVAAERKPLSQKAVQFGGTDEYVTMGNVLGFERTNAFSLSFWVKKPNASAAVLIAKMDDSYVGFRVYTETGISIDLINNPVTNRLTVGTGIILADQAWHFIVITYDGSSSASGIAIYDNGVPLSTTTSYNTLSASILNTVAFTLGRAMTSASPLYFVGYLDDVAVYDKKLSADEVRMLSQGYSPQNVSPDDLVAYWKMGDDSSYPTLRDDGPNGYDGTMTNMESSDIGYDVPLLPVWDVRGYDVKVVPGLGSVSHDYESVRVPGFAMAGGTTVEPGGATKYYKMRAQDSGATPPGYVSWVVQDDPDFAGAGYAGGSPTPVGPFVPGSIVVAAEWQE